MISFVIPTYNCVWLPQAVDSISKQTERDWEIVIVDDCSTDSTGKYLDWLERDSTNVRVFRNVKNLGRSVSRNLGNKEAKGSHIFVLDADDMAMPKRIEYTMEKFKDGVEFVYGSSLFMDSLGNKTGEHKADVFDIQKAMKEKVNRIVHSTVAYTKEFAMKYPYKESASDLGLDDWEQQLEAQWEGAGFDFTTKEVCAYRQLKTAVSNVRDPKKVEAYKDEYLDGLEVPA